jgi:aminopeptidase N
VSGRRLRAVAFLCFWSLAGAAAAHAPSHVELEVELDPQTRRLSAVAEFVATHGALEVSLHESLTVHSARADGESVAVRGASPRSAQRVWRIDAPTGARVSISWGGTLPALDATLDHRAVLRTSTPMAAPEGSFLPAAGGWYPRPRGAHTHAVTLSLPSAQRGLVAGRLASETLPSLGQARYVARFEHGHAGFGIDLIAGPYTVEEVLVPRPGAEPLRLRTYFHAELEPLARAYLEDSRRYIELYSERIGAYPYSSFSVVSAPLPTGFAMPTLTYLGVRVIRLPFIRETALRHEVLHNWWGNGVAVDYRRGNWAEGLTTFMADYAHREERSPEAARDMRLGWLRDFAAIADTAQRPLSEFRARTHGAEASVGYGKSAMIFLMLRDLVGEDVFMRAVREFWRERHFRTASWDDLREAFERESGRTLGRFFQQWLHRAGGPGPSVAEARAHPAPGGRFRLVLDLVQTAPAYELTVPLEIVHANDSEMRLVSLAATAERIELELDRAPHAVRLDPELRLWRVLDRESLPPILRDWILARAPELAIVTAERRFMAAARELAAAFLESPPREAPPDSLRWRGGPLLLVGSHGDIERALERLDLPPRPAPLSGRGSAQVWTLRAGAAGRPVAVISARDARALAALARALPHYGAQSYLAFDGPTVIERGTWPASVPIVPVRRTE